MIQAVDSFEDRVLKATPYGAGPFVYIDTLSIRLVGLEQLSKQG